MTSWPHEIAGDEPIVRGICSPYHLDKKGQVTPRAYRSPPGKDEISVMRAAWIGANCCKRRAAGLGDPDEGKIYCGLAVLSATQIRTHGGRVVDTREVFDGHADIRFGWIPVRGEPPPPALLLALKALSALAAYYPDPDPEAATWTGPELHYKG